MQIQVESYNNFLQKNNISAAYLNNRYTIENKSRNDTTDIRWSSPVLCRWSVDIFLCGLYLSERHKPLNNAKLNLLVVQFDKLKLKLTKLMTGSLNLINVQFDSN